MDIKVGNYLIVKDSNSIEVHYIKEVKANSLNTFNTYFSFSNYSIENTKNTLLLLKEKPYEYKNRVFKDDVIFTSDSIDEICTFIDRVHTLKQKLTEIQKVYTDFMISNYSNLEQATEAFNKAKASIKDNSDWATYSI